MKIILFQMHTSMICNYKVDEIAASYKTYNCLTACLYCRLICRILCRNLQVLKAQHNSSHTRLYIKGYSGDMTAQRKTSLFTTLG